MSVSNADGNVEPLPPDLAAADLVAVVERFTPLLHAQANYRLGRLRQLYDADDIVNDVWARALPHLAELCARPELLRAVVLKFLTTTLHYRVRDLAEKHFVGKPEARAESLSLLPEQHSGVVTRAARGERATHLRAALQSLAEEDRAVLVLRGIEQRPFEDVASALTVSPEACKKRYQRALARLRATLGDDLADDFLA